MSNYQYEVNENSPWEVRITGEYYNTLYTFNINTNKPFASYDDAVAFATEKVNLLENPLRYEIWYHVDITGGDNKIPVGIKNDGIESLTITITARETEDVASHIIPINDSFRIDIKTEDGLTYDIILVNFVDGVGVINYTDNNSRGNSLRIAIAENIKVSISEDGAVSVIPIGSMLEGTFYSVHLFGDTSFVVYRVA